MPLNLGSLPTASVQIYHDLFYELHFEKAFIPLSGRLPLEESDCSLNEDGIPCCPKAPSLPMKREILSFSNKISKKLSKPDMKFTADMTYGILASKSGHPVSIFSQVHSSREKSFTSVNDITSLLFSKNIQQ